MNGARPHSRFPETNWLWAVFFAAFAVLAILARTDLDVLFLDTGRFLRVLPQVSLIAGLLVLVQWRLEGAFDRWQALLRPARLIQVLILVAAAFAGLVAHRQGLSLLQKFILPAHSVSAVDNWMFGAGLPAGLLIGDAGHAAAALINRIGWRVFLAAWLALWFLGEGAFQRRIVILYVSMLALSLLVNFAWSPFLPLINWTGASRVEIIPMDEFEFLRYRIDHLIGPLGFSVFPDLHVCFGLLASLVFFRINRVLGFAIVALTWFWWLAGLGLGLHYFIDGVAGLAVFLVPYFILFRKAKTA